MVDPASGGWAASGQPSSPDQVPATHARRPTGSSQRLSRKDLRSSAELWNGIGLVFLVLAAIGAVAAGMAFAPEKVTGGGIFRETQKDSGAGVAIGAAVFVGSLVTIL